MILVYDMFDNEIDNIVENTSYAFLWMFTIIMLRREYIIMGKTSLILIIYWFLVLSLPLASISFTVYENNAISSDFRPMAVLISLFFNSALIIFCLIKPIDIGDIYSKSSTGYQQMLKAYFVEDEESLGDPEKVWDKFDEVVDRNISIIERENIKNIIIKETKTIEESSGTVVLYIMEICYGKTRDMNRTVMRRYREFIEMYHDLRNCNPEKILPEFPGMTATKKDVTAEVIKKRMIFFNEIFEFIVSEKLNSPVLNKFLTSAAESEFIQINSRDRIMSTVQESTFSVNIPKATKEKQKFMTHARYEIVVQCGKFSIITYHRFSDFKDLRKNLSKRYRDVGELPESYVMKSSINPKVVKERKIRLASFLHSLLDRPELKADADVVSFLKLDKIVIPVEIQEINK
ncbi:hypothetical protein SteCoe_30299 [Stentor coeruleus]|uniref:PX domain-containing protein n=1 Tax=Stentor coeruleus TaxID=5963 RepID=A0A1R2B3X6_9CILI|nr:hypothetical protein SteCoe_30299 [Stentor coeruleus]